MTDDIDPSKPIDWANLPEQERARIQWLELSQENMDALYAWALRDKAARAGLHVADRLSPHRAAATLPAISAFVSARSAERQEQILAEQHETLAQMLESTRKHGLVMKEQQQLLDALRTETERSGKTTRRLALASVFIAVLALLVSGFAAWTSLRWEGKQTALLKTIAENTAPTTQPGK